MYFVEYGKGLTLISLCYSSVHQKRTEPESSCVSMRSDGSMGHPIKFKSGDTNTDLRYVFMFSAGQRLIASKIKVFVYIIYMCVYCVYLLCVYKYTRIHVYI